MRYVYKRKPETHWCEVSPGNIIRQPGNHRDCVKCKIKAVHGLGQSPTLTGIDFDSGEEYGEHNDYGAGDPSYFGDH